MKKLPRPFHVHIELTAPATVIESEVREFVATAMRRAATTLHQSDPLSYSTCNVLSVKKLERS